MPTNPKITDSDLRHELAVMLNSHRKSHAYSGNVWDEAYALGLRLMAERIQFSRELAAMQAKLDKSKRELERERQRRYTSDKEQRKAREYRRGQRHLERIAEAGL